MVIKLLDTVLDDLEGLKAGDWVFDADNLDSQESLDCLIEKLKQVKELLTMADRKRPTFLFESVDDEGNTVYTEQPCTDLQAAQQLAKDAGHPNAKITLAVQTPENKGGILQKLRELI
jgi:3-methyladenine DNA glycosylase AlkC